MEIQENAIELRNYFPETWLFDMVDLDESGTATLDLEAPHTVTTWVGSVVCSDANTGLGISEKSSLTVSQDFFVDVNMPYAIKRGEVLPLNVTVFNSVSRPLPMTVTILSSEAELKVKKNKQ